MTRTTRLLAALVLSVIGLAVPASADAASITLSRNPAPPEAVKNDGLNQLRFNYQITFTTTPVKRVTRIIAPNNTPVAGSTQTTSMTGATSPFISTTEAYTVPAGLAPGRYLVEVAFYSAEFCDVATCPSPADDANYEARALVQFDVAAATGNITVRKFEDVNGNGIREASEPSLANWPFSVTAPQPDFVGTDNYNRSTGGDGTFTLQSVPAGPLANYNISEVLPSPNPDNWAPTTSPNASFILADGETRNIEVGNARLTSLCGTVYKDADRDGVRDAEDVVFDAPAVTLALGGTDGRGNAVTATTTTNSQGRYCFTGLMPGTYSVTETVPANWEATGDADGSGNGPSFINPIVLQSGQPSDGHDFGLAQPIPPGAICGTVYLDENRNGQRDKSEPVFVNSKVTLRLDSTTIAVRQTATNDQGRYCFGGLTPGNYSVTETVPDGFEATGDADGPDNGRNIINPIRVEADRTTDGQDFGLARPNAQPTPTPQTKLCLTKSVSKKKVRQGQSVVWKLRVKNCGKHKAFDVAVNDPLLPSATLVSRGKATLVRGQLVWSVGTLAKGKSKTFTFKTRFDRDSRTGKHVNRATAAGSNTNTARASASTVVVKVKRRPVYVPVTG